MKIHRGNESFSCCWLLLLVALLLAEAAAAAAATLSETQTNATNGAIREPPVQLQQQQKLQNATAGDGESQNSAEIFIHSDMGKFSSILPVKKHTRTLKHSRNEKTEEKLPTSQNKSMPIIDQLAADETTIAAATFEWKLAENNWPGQRMWPKKRL